MKPLGLTTSFQVVTPTRGEDAVWRAVEEAIDAGMTPERFKAEAAEAWVHFLRERAKDAERTLLDGK
jgi:hypothetical protein